MRPRPVPRLNEEASIRFVEEDERPLGDNEKKHLKKCLEIYRKNPIQSK